MFAVTVPRWRRCESSQWTERTELALQDKHRTMGQGKIRLRDARGVTSLRDTIYMQHLDTAVRALVFLGTLAFLPVLAGKPCRETGGSLCIIRGAFCFTSI